MITEKDISFLCFGRNTFARGELIYKVKNVKDFQMKYLDDGNKVKIKAKVKGSNIDNYEVKAVVDETAGKIGKTFCDCMAFGSYSGLCKHIVAMLLEYISERDGRDIDSVSVPGRSTDMGFGKIMDQFSLEKRANFMQPEIAGKVRLMPEIYCVKDDIRVAFRIGVNAFYTVKDLRNFVKEIRSGEEAYYGAKLKFYNTLGAYTKSSAAMVRFIMACEEQEMNNFNYGYGAYAGKQHWYYISLQRNILDEFMDIVMGCEITFDAGYSGNQKVIVREGLEKEKLRIEGDEDGITIYKEKQTVWYGMHYIYIVRPKEICRIEREKYEILDGFIRYSNACSNTGIFVSKQEIPSFVRDMLPELKEMYNIKTNNFDLGKYLGNEVKFKIYLDAPETDIITCKALAFYGDSEGINIFDHSSPGQERDITREMMTASKIHSMFNAFDPAAKCPVLGNDTDKLFYLLTEGIAVLRQLGEVFVSDDIKKIKVSAPPKFEMGISLKGDLLELEMIGEKMSMEQLAEVLSRYDRKKKYYRLKNGDFITMDSEEMIVLSQMAGELQIDGKELAKGKVRLPKYRAAYLEDSLGRQTSITVSFDENFRSLVENIKGTKQLKIPVPASQKKILREYQVQGFKWLMALKMSGLGAVLADEMGLGKTLQVIALMAACRKKKGKKRPFLVVCPASLVYNWRAEIMRFAPELNPVMVIGSVEERKEIIKNIAPEDIVITSYDILKRDEVFYENQIFECEIIDEAQYIKNHNTQAAKAVKLINAEFKAALTGTPVENRLSELWSIFDYIMPGFLYSYSRFREEVEIPVVMQEDEKKLEFLQRMIGPFVLRRLKKDVLKFLPEKIEKNMYTNMEKEQRELYQAHIQRIKMLLESKSESEFHKSKIQILAELTRLRQLCCSPALIYEGYKGGSAKLVMCMELIQNAIEGGHKVLLFSQFTGMLEIIRQGLCKAKIPFLTLTGATSKEQRAQLVKEFNEGEIPVFCISLKAGGTGLNLTAADIVIHYDPWWNVAAQNQATDRAHRIGQDKVVTVYKLIAKDTIEEGIVELQDKKRELADEILGGENVGSGEFTREQLLELLG